MTAENNLGRRKSEQGYMLIAMMLFLTLLLIAAAAVAPELAMQVKRDREEEMIHRGVQYSRAIRNYVKKNGRYPTRLEDLENTNNIRYLRKRFKDPVNGKDFKLLHLGDVQLTGGAGIVGAGAVGQNGLIQQVQGQGGQISKGGLNGGFGSGGLSGGLNGGLNGTPGRGVSGPLSPATPPTEGEGTTPADKSPSNGATGTADSGTNGSATVADPSNPSSASTTSGTSNSPNGGPNGNGPTGNNGQVFGGGPIVGVASTSKDKTIRIFNKKDHYNDWQFIYDPSSDRGGLLTTPAQPSLQNNVNGQTGQPGRNGQPGQTNSPFGQPGQSNSPFGSGNNPGLNQNQSQNQNQQQLAPSFPPDQQPQP